MRFIIAFTIAVSFLSIHQASSQSLNRGPCCNTQTGQLVDIEDIAACNALPGHLHTKSVDQTNMMQLMGCLQNSSREAMKALQDYQQGGSTIPGGQIPPNLGAAGIPGVGQITSMQDLLGGGNAPTMEDVPVQCCDTLGGGYVGVEAPADCRARGARFVPELPDTLSDTNICRPASASGGGAVDTRYVYDGDALVAEYTASGTLLRRYVHGPGIDEPVVWFEGSSTSSSARRHLRANRQGSVVAVTNASGALIHANTYSAYGKKSGSNGGRFQYTGQIDIPELDLYYYKARLYSPQLGRFLQTDPIGYEDQMNLYAYVGNDPMNMIDPTGECSVGVAAFAGGAALADGPIPIGDAIGAVALAGNCMYKAAKSITRIVTVTSVVSNNETPQDENEEQGEPKREEEQGEPKREKAKDRRARERREVT